MNKKQQVQNRSNIGSIEPVQQEKEYYMKCTGCGEIHKLEVKKGVVNDSWVHKCQPPQSGLPKLKKSTIGKDYKKIVESKSNEVWFTPLQMERIADILAEQRNKVQKELISGENLRDYLTHGLWCSKCGFEKRIGEQGKNAFFIQNGESVCKKHYKKGEWIPTENELVKKNMKKSKKKKLPVDKAFQVWITEHDNNVLAHQRNKIRRWTNGRTVTKDSLRAYLNKL